MEIDSMKPAVRAFNDLLFLLDKYNITDVRPTTIRNYPLDYLNTLLEAWYVLKDKPTALVYIINYGSFEEYTKCYRFYNEPGKLTEDEWNLISKAWRIVNDSRA